MGESGPTVRHAGLVALRWGGTWRGVLIEGPSGAGKSDLALRALDAGFRLVADDRTMVFASGGRPFGRAAPPLGGLIEVRGLGVVVESGLRCVEIGLVARCVRTASEIDRCPEPDFTALPGGHVPVLHVFALEDSAPAKLRRAIEHLGREGATAYQTRLAQGRSCAET
jgi:serine kinase of HPr protein (carbohydrate metabolism regulator)